MRSTVCLIAFDGDPHDTEAVSQHRQRVLYANRPYNLPVTYAVVMGSGVLLLVVAHADNQAAKTSYRTIVTILGIVLIVLPIVCAWLFGCGVRRRRRDAHD